MELMTVTFNFVINGEPSSNTRNYGVGRVGHGAQIHLLRAGDGNALCGTGNNSRGTRGRRAGKLSDGNIREVTCEKCLAEIGRISADSRNSVVIQ